jgi:hypothetical protein
VLADRDEDLVAGVRQLLDLEIDDPEGAQDVAPGLPHALVAVGDRLGIHRRRAPTRQVPDDVLRVQLERGDRVARGNGVVDPAHDLDVLL